MQLDLGADSEYSRYYYPDEKIDISEHTIGRYLHVYFAKDIEQSLSKVKTYDLINEKRTLVDEEWKKDKKMEL